MTKLICLTVLLALFAGTCAAAQPQPTKEETCKANITQSIKALEALQDSTGKEQSLSGLTIEGIRKIEAEQGVCAASQAINNRYIGK